MKNSSDKCIVNNNAENMKAPTMLISMKYTQNWVKYTKTESHPRSIAHSNVCTRLFGGKMHSDWFHGVEIVQGRWHHGEEVGYWYPCRLEKQGWPRGFQEVKVLRFIDKGTGWW
jgi:hypothetical protein